VIAIMARVTKFRYQSRAQVVRLEKITTTLVII
jgi:hypothetical protein